MAGKVVHFTIPIDDPVRALPFYQRAFGWEMCQWGPVDYWSISCEAGEGIEGGLSLRSATEPMPVVYVAVESVDEASRRVVDAGGRLVAERMAIPGTGWIARVTDTEGNVLGLFERDAPAWVAD